MGGLTLPGLLRMRAAQAAAGRPAKDTSVVWLFLSGGPSHLDTYDPKPAAPAEYRGPFNPISTNVPGVEFTDLMPRQAKIMDKMSVVRTLSHKDGNHGSAAGRHGRSTDCTFPRIDRRERSGHKSPDGGAALHRFAADADR